LLGVVGAAYGLTKILPSKRKYTAESARTQSFTLILFIAFTLYTGVSTRIFRLFKCQKIEETWYLTADYTVKCRTGRWNGYAAIAGACIIVYVIGLPAFQLYVLLKNRVNLHRQDCKDQKTQRRLEKELGSIYSHYKPHAFYFDVVDLLRRLVLTGGLIMMGEESVAQIFLGVVVCVAWVCLLIYKMPYAAMWDNVIAIMLALHLVLTLVAGMAIKLYAVNGDQNEYQRVGFDVVLTIVTALCVCLSIGSTIVGMPWVQQWYKARQEKKEARRLKAMQTKPRRWSGVNRLSMIDPPTVEMTQTSYGLATNPRHQGGANRIKIELAIKNPLRLKKGGLAKGRKRRGSEKGMNTFENPMARQKKALEKASTPRPEWQVCTDAEGQTYYWNRGTNETVWEKP
jgi:hypothetical protein